MPDYQLGVTIDGHGILSQNLHVSEFDCSPGDTVIVNVRATIPANVLQGMPPAPLPPPREDIVTHLGTRCCCKHCPWEGSHG